jgi:hypothetical protein
MDIHIYNGELELKGFTCRSLEEALKFMFKGMS